MSFDGFKNGAIVDRTQPDFWYPSTANTPFYPDEEKFMFNCEPNCIKDDVRTICDMQKYSAEQLLTMAHLKMRNEMEIKQQRELLMRMVMENIEMRQLRHKLDISRLRKDTSRGSKTLDTSSLNDLVSQGKRALNNPQGGESWGRNRVRIVNEDEQASKISGKLSLPELEDDILWTRYIEKMASPTKKEKHELVRDPRELYNFEVGDDYFGPSPEYLLEANSHFAAYGDRDLDKAHQMNIELFKTEMCRSWTEFGICPYGNICRFAHGYGELRTRPKPHKYKTEMCKKFLSGYCPYGSRCCFVHNPKERQRILGRTAEDEKHSEQKRVSNRRWRPTPLHQRERIVQI